MTTGGPPSSATARPAPTVPSDTPADLLPALMPAFDRNHPILIAGGGIGGLAAAIALAGCGVASHVLERRPDFAEAGAGIQIGPNGVKALRALGVTDDLDGLAGRPAAVMIRDAVSGQALTSLPLGEAMLRRHGAPYLTAHRADLHAALLKRARTLPAISITTGFDVRSALSSGDEIRVRATSGTSIDGSGLIAADGLWSSLRQHVAPGFSPNPANRRAYRSIIPASAAPAELACDRITGLWLASGLHAVHYPVRGGAEIALVVVVAGREARPGWDATAFPGEVRALASGLAPSLTALISAAPAWGVWSLYELARLPRWSRGRIGLLGDAAHPMLPFLAQGAVMALEDAVVLARSILKAGDPRSFAGALEAYERERRSRVQRVVDAARRNGMIYHLSGVAAAIRNVTLSATGGARLIRGYDWLYGFDAAAPRPEPRRVT